MVRTSGVVDVWWVCCVGFVFSGTFLVNMANQDNLHWYDMVSILDKTNFKSKIRDCFDVRAPKYSGISRRAKFSRWRVNREKIREI